MTNTIYCSQCGASSPEGSGHCPRCGTSLYWASPSAVAVGAIPVQPYAGFWIRVAATLIDGVVQSIIIVPLVIMLALRLAQQLRYVRSNDTEPFLPIFT